MTGVIAFHVRASGANRRRTSAMGRLAAPPGHAGAAPPTKADARTLIFPFVSRRLT